MFPLSPKVPRLQVDPTVKHLCAGSCWASRLPLSVASVTPSLYCPLCANETAQCVQGCWSALMSKVTAEQTGNIKGRVTVWHVVLSAHVASATVSEVEKALGQIRAGKS